nr:MAG TPA: hypothetical protein [Caudoviricetes sp.]
MKGYKAFHPGMNCRGKQYRENEIFEESTAEICNSGMHFYENPLDTLDYYDLVNEDGSFNEFAPVESLAETKTDGKQFCTTKLKIGAKLSFGQFVSACVDFILEKAKDSPETSACDAQIGSSGKDARIVSSAYGARIFSGGDFAQIDSCGNAARIGSSAYGARIVSSGKGVQIGSSGACVQIDSCGDGVRIGSSGYGVQISSSGKDARIGSSAYGARIVSNAYGARIVSSGDFARISSSGSGARIRSTGEDSVICCSGNGNIVSAKQGSWITLTEWKYDEIKDRFVPVCVLTKYVDGEEIKANTPYKLKNGKFTEVKE